MNPDDSDQLVWLQTSNLRAGFDRRTGALAGLETTDGAWRPIDRAADGLAYGLLIPLPDQRYNNVDGHRQPLARMELAEDGSTLDFTWDRVESEHGGEHDIRVHTRISVVEDRFVFDIEVDNRSEFVVENVRFPSFGDLQPPDREHEFAMVGYVYAGERRHRLWPRFDNIFGYFGVDHPTVANAGNGDMGAIGAPSNPYLLLENGMRGLYLAVDEPRTDLVTWFAELRPGYGDSLEAQVPFQRRVSGHDVTTRFDTVHIPYVRPGECRALTPIALQAYDGDWHAGADLYVSRRSTWMTEPRLPAWTTNPHAWQQIQLNSSEDHLRIPFRELPTIAAECAERGVSAIQVVGWNDGGQDRNNPSHEADPRLGGADELRTAIAACQRIGVKVVLFTKFTWADRATERFRRSLHRLAIKDPYGDYDMHPGYRYHTATQLADINTRRLIPMCFGSSEWLEICEREFAKVVELGADGMLFDECMHHSPALLCFDSTHGHPVPDPAYGHDREFIARLRAGPARDVPDFLYAGEGCYDWEFEQYQLSYHRSEDPRHVPVMRYLRPHTPLMTALTGYDDRNLVAQCLLYRYVMSYEPMNFKGRLPDFEGTVAYGRMMDELRTRLREWFWDGTFRDTVGARVRGLDGEPHHPYAVFTSARPDGRPALAIANYSSVQPTTLSVELDTGLSGYRYRLIDDAEWRDASAGVELPPRSAAVVVPEA